jgi:hypothetical protein
MKDLSLPDVFRYMFPGMVAFSYFYICDFSLGGKFIETLGTLLSILGIISFIFPGSVLYLLYRPLYNHVIINIQDFFRIKSKNYRTYLKEYYQSYNIGTYEAMQLWVQIRDKYLERRYSQAMKATASGIHLI